MDIYLLYYFSKAIEFDKDEILDNIEFKGRQLGNFDAFLNRVSDLEHAYSKFEHCEKQLSPIFVIFNGSVILVSELHPLNANCSIVVRDAGKLISVKF